MPYFCCIFFNYEKFSSSLTEVYDLQLFADIPLSTKPPLPSSRPQSSRGLAAVEVLPDISVSNSQLQAQAPESNSFDQTEIDSSRLSSVTEVRPVDEEDPNSRIQSQQSKREFPVFSKGKSNPFHDYLPESQRLSPKSVCKVDPSDHYASPSSGKVYRDRQLTINFELWNEIFCVPTCFHMRIPKPCLYVCPYPEKRKSP